ncbi:MAG TPA: TrmH family RNA methyltransferase [Anaerolineales bacterium]|nr:TrmH family RNA methyltransferase [Anaerolineales bacterium]
MYNDRMPDTSYEIRLCESCGLRYPLVQGHPFGTRCPACLGNTRVLLSRQLVAEPGPASGPKEHLHGTKNMAVLLDNIRSAWNVGSILRSADGFGFAHAYLCGITPTADNEAVTKTALCAEGSVPWSYHKDAIRLIKGLKVEGWKVFALEDDPRSLPISQFTNSQSTIYQPPNPSVLIIGNEVSGVDPELLDLCDKIFYIPMLGEKKSFNVAIAFSIAAYALSARLPES